MGDAQHQPLQLPFNSRLRIEFQGSRVTSDDGLILVREMDERLGVSDLIAQHVTDPRGTNTRCPLRRPGPTIGLPPPGGLSGHKRRAAALPQEQPEVRAVELAAVLPHGGLVMGQNYRRPRSR
jgi:hypothetical protein